MNAVFASSALFADTALGRLWQSFWSIFNGHLQVRGQVLAWWVPLVLGFLAIVAVGVLYAKESGRLSIFRRLALAAVRLTTIALVAFLMLRPVWVSESTNERRRPVVVLIDNSQSMDNSDPRPAVEDQWRAALAYGLVDPKKPLPTDPVPPHMLDSREPRERESDQSKQKTMPARPKRIEVAREALRNSQLNLFSDLRGVGPLEVYTFGETRTGRDNFALEWLNKLPADQPRTAIVNSALELLNRDDNDLPTAIVIVTDGRENASDKSLSDLAARCRAKRIPLHIYGVGSSSFGQLRLRDAGVPESVFLDDTVVIPVRYAVKGVTDGTVDIVAKFGDREIAAKRGIRAKEGDDIREVLTFVPTKEDAELKKQDITITITVSPIGPGGVVLDTLADTTTKPTQVVSKKLKVLVVDGLPRVDFKFLQRALLRDRRVDARFFLTEGDREAMKSGYPWFVEFTRQLNGSLSLDREEFRKLLNEYDLLILGDIPGRFFSTEHQQIIKDFVAEGGGMLHIAGKWHGPREWLEGEPGVASIADVLPVELAPTKWPIQPQEGRYYQPFVPVVASSAAANPLIALEDIPEDNKDIWGRLVKVNDKDPTPTPVLPRANRKPQLPPIEWYYPVTRVKPGVEVFLVHPTARTPPPDSKPMPLLAGHYFGKGYVLFCAFDDTWRWRFNESDRYFGRFWSQCVYQAGVPRMIGTKLTQLSLDTLEPLQGRSGQVYARILDENFKPLKVDEIEATLERVDAGVNDKDRFTPVKLRKLDGADGEYVAPMPFNTAGRFKLSVDPRNKSPATMEYRVSLPPDHEQSPGAMAEDEMRRLAADSGSKENPGKFYHEEDLHTLAKNVKAQSSPASRREERVLWHWLALVGLVMLLSLEWFLRKFNGLS
jgi:hypothetical protein